MRKKSQKIFDLRIADHLSPYHDSQFSAFSTEVFARINQKHNRSGSPFTTLVDSMERKVASTGAGQPNYWRKTWFGADAYNVKIRGAELYCKKCSDFVAVVWSTMKPLAN